MGIIFKGVVVCMPWAHFLSVGIVKMQRVMAFVTGTPLCPKGNQHQPISVVSVASMYANDVEAKIWEST